MTDFQEWLRRQKRTDLVCAECKESIGNQTVRRIVAFGQERMYHPVCYEKVMRRLAEFYDYIMGDEWK